MRRRRLNAQVLVLAAGTALGLAFVVLPYTQLRELAFYDGAVLLSVGAVCVGVRRVWTVRRAPWLLTAIALAGFLLGELIWWSYNARGLDPFPSVADAVFLVSYVPLGLGAALMAAPEGEGRDRTVWLDAGVLSVVAGAVVWMLLMDPYAADPTLRTLDKAVTLAYPLADLFVLGFVLRLVLLGRTQTRAGLLYAAGIGLMLGADLWFSWLDLQGRYEPGSWVDLAWVVSYLLLAVAALDRSAARSPRPVAQGDLGRARLAMVLVAVGIPQAIAFARLARTGRLGITTPTIVAVAATVTMALVSVRLWSLLGVARRVEAKRGSDHLAALIHHSSDAILLLDGDGVITYASPAVQALWGRDPGAWRGGSVLDWVVEDERAGLTRQVEELADAPTGTLLEVAGRLVTEEGEIRVFEGTIRNLLADGAVGALVVTVRDVTVRHDLEAQLQRQAFHDDLTGLANRALFADRVAHALQRARRAGTELSVLFIDLDDFKAVNDGLGHGVGDELLRQVAGRITMCVRPADTVARLGGDEFAVLLEDLASVEQATAAAERIREMLSMPVPVLNSNLAVPASIGIATRTADSTVESLLRDADIAMYRAKRSGKGRVAVFDDGLRHAAKRHIDLRIGLPHGLRAGQFHVVYQPIHDLRLGETVGFEALARWDHPELGAVPPAEFIPAAEESGFIIELGRWILEQACIQAVTWNDATARPLTMNVNISAVQLCHEGFVESVREVLERTGLRPELLTLELTESILVDPERTGAPLDRLRALGVGVAIDDFGTGYSSLSYLQQLPVTCVKIDRRFVQGLDGTGSTSLVRSILAFAEALGLQPIAEGIETPDQLHALGDLRCGLGQGYYLGRPATAAAIDARMTDSAPPAPVPGESPMVPAVTSRSEWLTEHLSW